MKSYRTISLAVALSFNIFLCGCLCASAFAAEPNADRIVVMMIVDGLANFYMDDPSAEMPTIRKLAAEGASAAGMRASDPTVTWPNHTTLVTGVPPAPALDPPEPALDAPELPPLELFPPEPPPLVPFAVPPLVFAEPPAAALEPPYPPELAEAPTVL